MIWVVDADRNVVVVFDFEKITLNKYLAHISLSLPGEKDGYVHVGPKRYTFPATFVKHAEHFYNFQAREDDIWVATFPRSGTTWTLELVWMIAHDLDYEGAERELLTSRSPFFE